MNLQKNTPLRSPEYLKFIRSRPCCYCLADIDIQAHHIRGLGGIMAEKPSDTLTIPLCAVHHSMLHSGNIKVDEKAEVAQMIKIASEQGLISVSSY